MTPIGLGSRSWHLQGLPCHVTTVTFRLGRHVLLVDAAYKWVL